MSDRMYFIFLEIRVIFKEHGGRVHPYFKQIPIIVLIVPKSKRQNSQNLLYTKYSHSAGIKMMNGDIHHQPPQLIYIHIQLIFCGHGKSLDFINKYQFLFISK